MVIDKKSMILKINNIPLCQNYIKPFSKAFRHFEQKIEKTNNVEKTKKFKKDFHRILLSIREKSRKISAPA